MSGKQDYESDEVAEKITELAELLEVASIIALIVENANGNLSVIGPTVAVEVLSAIGDGASKELLTRGLAKNR